MKFASFLFMMFLATVCVASPIKGTLTASQHVPAGDGFMCQALLQAHERTFMLATSHSQATLKCVVYKNGDPDPIGVSEGTGRCSMSFDVPARAAYTFIVINKSKDPVDITLLAQ